jgi:hypothetical protein
MSNYPNMSYCMCENTLLALQQVVNSMQEQEYDFFEDMSSHELQAYERLIRTCERFLEYSKDLEDTYHARDCAGERN